MFPFNHLTTGKKMYSKMYSFQHHGSWQGLFSTREEAILAAQAAPHQHYNGLITTCQRNVISAMQRIDEQRVRDFCDEITQQFNTAAHSELVIYSNPTLFDAVFELLNEQDVIEISNIEHTPTTKTPTKNLLRKLQWWTR
jgi:hypothetical protein